MRLPAPDGNLRVSVVIPAKNEEERIGACLDALAAQIKVNPSHFEVLLVLDGCTDSTEEIALERQARHETLRLHLLEGPDSGVGRARKLGMDEAYSRLVAIGRQGGLIASTDADSVVAPDWVAAQLSLVEEGAEAIGGRIILSGGGVSLPDHVLQWYEAQGRARYARILAAEKKRGGGFVQDHWQFSGASMSVTANAYRRIGGLSPLSCLEDEHLERALEAEGTRMVRSNSVKVTTSTRVSGRAEKGLAADLQHALGGLEVAPDTTPVPASELPA